MEQKSPLEHDRYSAADLTPDLLNRVISLEEDLCQATNKDVILIAYEESEHNPT